MDEKSLQSVVALLVIIGLGVIVWQISRQPAQNDPLAEIPETQKAPDVIDYAYRVCEAADATGLLSAPCSVSGLNQAVEMSIDTSGPEAIKICQGMADVVVGQGVKFEPGWQIRIYSPFSNGKTIAVCPLG